MAVAACLLSVRVYAAEAPEILRFATIAPEGSLWARAFCDIDSELQRKSDGRLRLKVYTGGVAGNENDVMRKMGVSQIDCAAITCHGLTGVLPDARILDLPRFYDNVGELDAVKEYLAPRFKGMFEEKGYVLLGWSELGSVYFFSKREINSISALRSCRMWWWRGDSLVKTLLDAVNVRSVPLPLAHVKRSLNGGVVDSVYASPPGVVALNWITRFDYMLNLPLPNAVGAVLMSRERYDGLAPELQTILRDAFAAGLQQLTSLVRRDGGRYVDLMSGFGVELIEPDEAFLEEFDKTLAATYKKISDRLFSSGLLAEVRGVVDGYRTNGADSRVSVSRMANSDSVTESIDWW